MTSTLNADRISLPQLLGQWWPVLLGALVLYIPTYWELAHGIWNTEEQAHGPIVLIVSLYLAWTQRAALARAATEANPKPVLGGLLLVVGLLLYAVGRSQSILMFEIGSQVFVGTGVLLLTLGAGAVRSMWFPLCFLVFMIPLPGFFVDAVTGPLKGYISILAEQALYAAGYPIARSGVVLTIGPYQLLVADACSGLHSMFSLSAMGLLYLYLMARTSPLRNLLLILAIIPVAFMANVVRVMVLILVTYHLGDEAGQGFLHGFAGVMLFMIGLVFLFLLDGILGFFLPDRAKSKSA